MRVIGEGQGKWEVSSAVCSCKWAPQQSCNAVKKIQRISKEGEASAVQEGTDHQSDEWKLNNKGFDEPIKVNV